MFKFNKDEKIAFLTGIIVGVFMMLLFIGAGMFVYKVSKKIYEHIRYGGSSQAAASAPRVSTASRSMLKTSRGKGFYLSFEKKDDASFFGLSDGLLVEEVSEHATDGSKSLLAEFPQGAKYPGLAWEVYRKDRCLNWSRAKYFTVSIFNNSETPVPLTIKFKSGSQYPKRQYETVAYLEPQEHNAVQIPISDLQRSLDVGEISYIKLFVNSPRETIVLYFDALGTE